MRKVFLDDLPRWGKGEGFASAGTINWSKCIGKEVKFIFDNIEGVVTIVNASKGCIYIKYKNKDIFKMKTERFKKGEFKKILIEELDNFKLNVGDKIEDDKRDYLIIDKEYRIKLRDEKEEKQKWYKYKCNKCGWTEGWIIESSLVMGTSCACCTNQVVVEGINDIPTTNPDIVKYFKGGYDEAKKYTIGSGKKATFICSICGKEFIRKIHDITRKSSSCGECKGRLISKIKNTCDEKDSFAMNDTCDKLKYWDYRKNKILPNEIYKNSVKKVWFLCERGHSFKISLSDIHGKRSYWCPHCSNIQKESRMATTLKQIFKHEFSNTIWEYDIGFKGENGGTSCYDIFIPELNLLVECQSGYHDEKTELDLNKKEFALNNGYYFVDIDYRDQSILDAVKMFFPYIKNIPQYVDYTKETLCNWDFGEAQYLLDNTDLTQKEICEKVGADWGSFISKVQSNALIVPKDKRKEKPVVQLNLKGEFVRRHDKATDFKKYGFNTPDISSCCKGNQHTHKGYIFMYERNYQDIKNESGCIELKKDYNQIILKTSKKKILQISLKGEIINEYSSLGEAQRATGFIVSNISACCSGVSKTSNGFIWMYKSEYENNKANINCILESAKPKMFKKAIICIDLEDNFKYEKYDSAREVERKTGLSYQKVSYKCRKKYNKKDEKIWMFEEDYHSIRGKEMLSIDVIDNFKIDKYNL